MVDSRVKGAKAETVVRDMLRKYTGLSWERVPGSGSLDPKHNLKGDLYIPGKDNIYVVECKHYADDHFTTELFTSKNPILISWWEQCVRQGIQVNKKPLLIFKHDRSKLFVMHDSDYPTSKYRVATISILDYNTIVSLLEDWLIYEKPKFIK